MKILHVLLSISVLIATTGCNIQSQNSDRAKTSAAQFGSSDSHKPLSLYLPSASSVAPVEQSFAIRDIKYVLDENGKAADELTRTIQSEIATVAAASIPCRVPALPKFFTARDCSQPQSELAPTPNEDSLMLDKFQLAASMGMSFEEIISLFQYSSMFYVEIGSALRTKDVEKLKAQSPKIFSIVSALNKIPNETIDGVSKLYRGSNLPPEVQAKYLARRKGDSFVEDAFVSTSYVESGAYKGNTYFLIHIKTPNPSAKKIDMFSRQPDEREVLIPPNAIFKMVADPVRVKNSLKPFESASGHASSQPVPGQPERWLIEVEY